MDKTFKSRKGFVFEEKAFESRGNPAGLRPSIRNPFSGPANIDLMSRKEKNKVGQWDHLLRVSFSAGKWDRVWIVGIMWPVLGLVNWKITQTRQAHSTIAYKDVILRPSLNPNKTNNEDKKGSIIKYTLFLQNLRFE